MDFEILEKKIKYLNFVKVLSKGDSIGQITNFGNFIVVFLFLIELRG